MKILILLALTTISLSSRAEVNDPILELNPQGVYTTSSADFQYLDNCRDQTTTLSGMIEPGYSIVFATFTIVLNLKTTLHADGRPYLIKNEVLKMICDDLNNVDHYTFTITNLDDWYGGVIISAKK
jgi:hypothetical protein